MTTYPIEQQIYNNAGKPFVVFNFFRFKPISRSTGLKVNYYFSDRRRTETVEVEDPSDGTGSTRVYVGGHHVLKVPPIKDTQGVTVDTHEIELSFTSTQVKDMIFGNYMSNAYFEWHQGQADPQGGMQRVARPVCEMFGVVVDVRERHSGKDKKTGKRDSAFIISVAGRHIEFEDANLSLRSYEEGLKRGGDKIFQFVESVGDWPIGWGKRLHRHRDHGNKGRRKDNEGRGPEIDTGLPPGTGVRNS